MPKRRRPLVLLGVSGSIAAYKAPELLRALQTAGFDVRVLLTRSARRFVTPLTFEALTGRPTVTSLWQPADPLTPEAPIEHITLAQAADLLLIAPATASTLARLAQGMAEDLLSAVALATAAPLVLAPAMNVNMLAHPATQANLATLRERGATVVEPAAGYLACGMVGAGRLAENESIVAAVQARLTTRQDLARETVLITAGGTREPLDPVRFLGNRSSGKMGHALAAAARRRGARVLLVTASPLPAEFGVEVTRVATAAEMHAAVLAQLSQSTAVIGAAAVADFRPLAPATEKLRRSGPLTLSLEPTEDILAEVVRHRQPGTWVLAFAAETHDVLESARGKLLRKGVDAIVANDISTPGLGFDSDRNAATFLTATGEVHDLGESTKAALADRILDQLVAFRASVHEATTRETQASSGA